MFKIDLRSDEFWSSISSLQREVSKKIKLEPVDETTDGKPKRKLTIKSVKTSSNDEL